MGVYNLITSSLNHKLNWLKDYTEERKIKYTLEHKFGVIHQSIQSVIQTFYDIVKAHGGELKVETKEGEGSEFIILLLV